MTKAEEILEKYPSVKLGLDDHYGRQTVLNALNEALRIHDVVGRSEQFFCNNERMGVRCVKQCLGCFQFENKD